MTFLSVISTAVIVITGICLERFVNISLLRKTDWFHHYTNWLLKYVKGINAYLALGLIIMPLVALIAIVGIFSRIPGVLLFWFFELVVLIYCLGPHNVFQGIRQYLKDSDTKKLEFLGELNLAGEPRDKAIAVAKASFLYTHEHLFAVIFWFAIFGLLRCAFIGAVIYFLIRELAFYTKKGGNATIKKLHKAATLCLNVLNWVPVRLLAMSFALGGNFNGVFKNWRKTFFAKLGGNDELLATTGINAMNISKKEQKGIALEKAALTLIDRALIIWLVILLLVFVI